jgi:hypothetical protein
MENSRVYSLVALLIGNYFVALLLIGLLTALISLLGKPRDASAVVEAFLSYYMLFSIGISYVINFVFHVFYGDLEHNLSPGNVGLVLPSDILTPLVGFVFLWLSYRHPKPASGN